MRLFLIVFFVFSLNLLAEKEMLELRVNTKPKKNVVKYLKTVPDTYMDHTNGQNTVSHWISGGAADSFAVYFKPSGTGVQIRTIESKWFDGDGATPVFAHIYSVAEDCPEDGISTGIGENTIRFIDSLLWGPIPFSPIADEGGDIWQVIELSDFGEDLVVGDANNHPVSFIVVFVKTAENPDPAAVDMADYGIEESHTWIKGPGLLPYWRYYLGTHEFAVRVGVGYFTHHILSLNGFPNTYDGSQDFVVYTGMYNDDFIPEGNLKLKYTINEATDTNIVTMTYREDHRYTAIISNSGIVQGDTIFYWAEAEDSEGLIYFTPKYRFTIIAPQNPDANILLVDDGMRINAEIPIKEYLEELDQQVEVFNIRDNRGWDSSITTYSGNNGKVYDAMIIMGFGTTSIPTREYEGSPVAAYLDAGGNLLYTDQDYFFTNNEGDTPQFTPGDFAYDYFSILSGINDPVENAITSGYGIDFLSDFSNIALDYSIFEVDNWPDFLIEKDAVPILLSTDPSGNYPDSTLGTFFSGDGFNTILFAAPILAMNEGTADNVILSNDFKELLWHCLNDGFEIELPNSIEENNDNLSSMFNLRQNFPNPFNPSTYIEYSLEKIEHVDLTIYNNIGQKVKTLVNQQKTIGEHTVQWDGKNSNGLQMPSGIYYYHIKAGGFTQIRKMVLMK